MHLVREKSDNRPHLRKLLKGSSARIGTPLLPSRWKGKVGVVGFLMLQVQKGGARPESLTRRKATPAQRKKDNSKPYRTSRLKEGGGTLPAQVRRRPEVGQGGPKTEKSEGNRPKSRVGTYHLKKKENPLHKES